MFEDNLVYTVRFRTARAIRRNPVTKESLVIWPTLLIPPLQRQRKAHVNLWFWRQPGVLSLFQNSQGYRDNPCLKKGKKEGWQQSEGIVWLLAACLETFLLRWSPSSEGHIFTGLKPQDCRTKCVGQKMCLCFRLQQMISFCSMMKVFLKYTKTL